MSDKSFLEIIRERGGGALGIKMGIEIIEASPQRLVATMPVEGNTQPIGLLHGGANDRWSRYQRYPS
jgi:acyl-coenzyme A thioesterase PaaI-like protein